MRKRRAGWRLTALSTVNVFVSGEVESLSHVRGLRQRQLKMTEGQKSWEGRQKERSDSGQTLRQRRGPYLIKNFTKRKTEKEKATRPFSRISTVVACWLYRQYSAAENGLTLVVKKCYGDDVPPANRYQHCRISGTILPFAKRQCYQIVAGLQTKLAVGTVQLPQRVVLCPLDTTAIKFARTSSLDEQLDDHDLRPPSKCSQDMGNGPRKERRTQ